VGLQEVAFLDAAGEILDQPTELARLTGREVRYGAVHSFPLIEPETGQAIGSATWGNAILTRTPIRDGVALGLPIGRDDDVVEPPGCGLPLAGITFAAAPYGTREPRCAVAGRLEDDGTGVSVVVTHLTYVGVEQRRAQAEAVARLVREARGPVLLLADLNAPIDAPALAPLTSALDDAFSAIGVPAADERRASCGALAIDHILSRGLEVVDCRVTREVGDLSDHLPVVATLRHASRSLSSSRTT
jgi:endonuclease/exonuclease/phosphatase family metal-dependent hydrolase